MLFVDIDHFGVIARPFLNNRESRARPCESAKISHVRDRTFSCELYLVITQRILISVPALRTSKFRALERYNRQKEKRLLPVTFVRVELRTAW